MALYAGETIVLGTYLLDELQQNKPFTPQPSTGVTAEVLGEDGTTVVSAETSLARQYLDRGDVASAGTLTLTDTTKTWKVNEWLGKLVRITAGAGVNQERRILSNTSTVLTMEPGTQPGQGAWATPLDATSDYEIHESRYEVAWSSTVGLKDKTLNIVFRAKDTLFTGIEKKKLRLE